MKYEVEKPLNKYQSTWVQVKDWEQAKTRSRIYWGVMWKRHIKIG